MTQPPAIAYASVAPRSADEGHLQALAICHYVWGGLMMLFSCIFIVHIVIGVAMTSGAFGQSMNANVNGVQQSPPAIAGYILIAFGSIAIVLGWTLGSLTIYSGRCIAGRRRHLFSLIVAGFNCISFPLGTTLGVFTFLVLLRQSVKQIYQIN